jgi:hypothetical protein
MGLEGIGPYHRVMSPRSRRGTATPRTPRTIIATILATIVLVAACGAEFDPNGPCTADGKVSGAYPDMEAAVPKTYNGTPPNEVDSGRTCSTSGLGALAGHGVKELRFAGATWQTGTQSGLTLATFASVDGPTLDPAWLSEFYETTAQGAKNIQSIDTSDLTVANVPAHRLDVLNDESYQTVIVWPKEDRVMAVLVGDFIREVSTKDAHEKIVQAALDAAFGGNTGG